MTQGRMKGILLVSDMDGTLLDGRQRISPENREAIRRFQEEGGLFTLATGRTAKSVEPYLRELEIQLPVILYNGAQVYDPVGGRVLHERTLQVGLPLWTRLAELAVEEAALVAYKDGQAYAPHRNVVLEEHEGRDGSVTRPIGDLGAFGTVTKLMFVTGTPEKARMLEGQLREIGVEGELVFSEDCYLEVLPRQATKGDALRVLVKHIGTEGLRTVGIGNHLNDVTLLQIADFGVAVANAMPEVKQAAQVHTVHHEEHALADLIARLPDIMG